MPDEPLELSIKDAAEGITLDPATGVVTIAPGTAKGAPIYYSCKIRLNLN